MPVAVTPLALASDKVPAPNPEATPLATEPGAALVGSKYEVNEPLTVPIKPVPDRAFVITTGEAGEGGAVYPVAYTTKFSVFCMATL
jgi:hypothetical protein